MVSYSVPSARVGEILLVSLLRKLSSTGLLQNSRFLQNFGCNGAQLKNKRTLGAGVAPDLQE